MLMDYEEKDRWFGVGFFFRAMIELEVNSK